MKTKITAIIPAAGLGKRFNLSGGKIFAGVRGAPLLAYTLKRLHREDSITEIIPVLRRQDIEKGFDMIKALNLDKIRRIAPGGQERQDSIYNALKLVEEDGAGLSGEMLIMVHDGARPVIPENTIQELLKETEDADGAAPGIPARDTLKKVSEDGIIVSTLERGHIRAIQTPQLFSFDIIKKAYDAAYKEGFHATDDAALVERAGGRVKIITGSPFNIKVTTPEDLDMVEYILSREQVPS